MVQIDLNIIFFLLLSHAFMKNNLFKQECMSVIWGGHFFVLFCILFMLFYPDLLSKVNQGKDTQSNTLEFQL